MGEASPQRRIRAPRRTPRRQPFRVTAAVAPLPFARITASLPAVPLPVPRSSGWEDREGRLRGLAPSSGLVCSSAIADRGDPLLPGLGSSSRSFPHDRRSVSHRVRPRSPTPEGVEGSRASSASHPRPMAGAIWGSTVGRRSARGENRARGAGSWADPCRRSEDRCRGWRARRGVAEAMPERRAWIGEPSRSWTPEPDPVGIPSRVHRARCTRVGRPTFGRGGGFAFLGPPKRVREGDLDAVEVCPEPKSRGAAAAGCPAAIRRSSPTFMRFLTSKNAPRSVSSVGHR